MVSSHSDANQESQSFCEGTSHLHMDQSWDETFTYSLDFDDELKVTDYQVWADSGAAYLARLGKLDDLKVCSFTRVYWNELIQVCG